jgi:acetyltransferase-like isoleucine patch superfamily enzyme
MLIANIRCLAKLSWSWIKNVLFFDPMIRYHCNKVGKNIVFQGTYPLIKNSGYIEIGDNATFVGRNNLIVGFNVPEIGQPRLIIGNNVTIGYQNEINVAYRVEIGNYVRMATRVKIFDNNSHPTSADRRRNRLPMTMEDIAPVVIQDDAWIGMDAIILKGVTIGKGAIVAAGSVVTESVPDHVIVAGNPARVVKVMK